MIQNGTLLLGMALLTISASVASTDPNGWQLVATEPDAPYVGAAMANGCIGILPWKEPFSVRNVVLNHVFDTDGEGGVSKVLTGINPFLLEMQIDGHNVTLSDCDQWQQTIDMKEATHTTTFTVGNKIRVKYTLCALRNVPYSGAVRVEMEALMGVDFKVVNRMKVPDEYDTPTRNSSAIWGRGERMDICRFSALSKYRKHLVSASSVFEYDHKYPKVQTSVETDKSNALTGTLKQGDKFTFTLFGSVCSDRDFLDPCNESDRQAIYCSLEGWDKLFEAHKILWTKLWQGDIQIEGDNVAQRVIRFALFNLYSSVRENSALSIPPMGLSERGYNGHIFWDAELWMYPPLLYLNQPMARSMVDYRIHRMKAAKTRAATYGYRGTMFPWESDDAGEESCPTYALTGPFEHHITACIGIATWNYYLVTGNRRWLREEGFPLIRQVADFWTSRVTENKDGSYSILGVVCADEYAENVDDNAFTNGAVKEIMQIAVKAAKLCGEQAEPQWSKIGNGLRILKFENGITREYATYDGRITKQADANLLGYPLHIITDIAQQKRDMAYYLPRMDVNGPAMSFSVLCVQYARMGEAQLAYKMFCKSYQPNLRPPFGVIAESATSNNPYFTTGAGGMLQAVMCGFGGLEITDKGIRQGKSILPPTWKKLTITGVGPDKQTFIRER